MSRILKGRAAAAPVLRMLMHVMRGGTIERDAVKVGPGLTVTATATRYAALVPHTTPEPNPGEWFAALETLGQSLMEAANRIAKGGAPEVEIGNLQLRAEAELVRMTETMVRIRKIAQLELCRAGPTAIPLTMIDDLASRALGEAIAAVPTTGTQRMTGSRAVMTMADGEEIQIAPGIRIPRSR